MAWSLPTAIVLLLARLASLYRWWRMTSIKTHEPTKNGDGNLEQTPSMRRRTVEKLQGDRSRTQTIPCPIIRSCCQGWREVLGHTVLLQFSGVSYHWKCACVRDLSVFGWRLCSCETGEWNIYQIKRPIQKSSSLMKNVLNMSRPSFHREPPLTFVPKHRSCLLLFSWNHYLSPY